MTDKNISLDDEVVCQCSGTTRAKVQNLFEQGLNIEEISQRTGIITGCGGCEWDIAQLVNELSAQQHESS